MVKLIKGFLVVISATCVAKADLSLAESMQKNQQQNQYQPGLGQTEGEGWVDPGSGISPSPYNSTRPSRPDYGQDTRSVWIQRNVTNERMDLRALAGLDYSYNGWEIVSVRASSRPNSAGRTVVQLIADGRIVATQTNPGYQIYLTPQVRLILGSNVRSVQLLVNGSTFISDLQIDLRNAQNGPVYPPQPPLTPEPPPYPGNPNPPTYPGNPGNPGYNQNVDISIYKNLYGNDRVDLTQYVDLSRYRGRRIQQVIVQGSRVYNPTMIDLIINGNNMGRVAFSGSYSQSQSIWLSQQPMIGQGADSIVLYSSGQMTLERVTLVLR